MAGAAISVEFDDLGSIGEVVDALGLFVDFDRTDLLEALASEVESQTRRRISDEKTSPDGVAWPEWSEGYAGSRHGPTRSHRPHPGALRESGGHSLLVLSGDLLDSVTSEVSGDEVVVGSNLVYAATHQYGRPEDGIPKREFVGLSDDDLTALEALTIDFLGDLMP